MSFTEAVAAYAAGEIDAVSAMELTGCDSLIELYEGAAEEEEAMLFADVA
ncbi:hypothetical protein [Aureimonas sp. Leaf454]|nr:hypothetical protein [Aureimonas sp. Leaf454]